MNEQTLKQYRTQLTTLQAELRQLEIDSQDASRTVELDQPAIGRLSRMDALQGQAMAQETARRRKHQLTRIAGALHRIDNSDYGYCAICEEELDERRLAIDPTTTRCLGCLDGP